ncbi:hypothetical protein [uncultured Ruminococcus sp.]|uniref:hypothetical protein n=1 Tax=uncultured Ruminococcus sp. TaxID=165186 RepID=UPI00260984FA|nr:hypothetical protein [uncultured Ruminococcus sp.]
MNRITGKQFCAMAFIGDIFAVLCMSGEAGAMTAAGFGAGALVQLLAAMLFAEVYRRGRVPGKVLEAVLLLWIIIWGGVLFTMQWRTSEVIYIPFENSGAVRGKLFVSGLIALVCLYIASAGIKALGRASVIAAATGAVCLAVVAASALAAHDWDNLRTAGSGLGFGGEFVRGLRASGGIAGYIVLLGLLNGSYVRETAVCFIGKGIASAALILTVVLVTGGIMEIADFPAVRAAQLTQPFPSQRIDSLFLIVFAVYAVFSIAVQSAAAAHLAGKLIPPFRRYRCLTVLALMIGAAFLLSM